MLVEGVGGTTHAGSLFGNACVDDTVAAYLRTRNLPKCAAANAADLRCRPLAPPDPSASAAKRAAEPLSRADLQKRIGVR